jgi:hypothetical protein
VWQSLHDGDLQGSAGASYVYGHVACMVCFPQHVVVPYALVRREQSPAWLASVRAESLLGAHALEAVGGLHFACVCAAHRACSPSARDRSSGDAGQALPVACMDWREASAVCDVVSGGACKKAISTYDGDRRHSCQHCNTVEWFPS